MGFVVRIAGVGVNCNDWRIVGQKIFAGEGLHEPLLDLMFLGAAVAHPLANFLERRRDNGIDAVSGRARCDPILLFASKYLNCATRACGNSRAFLPRPRSRSMVPPSTSEIVNYAVVR